MASAGEILSRLVVQIGADTTDLQNKLEEANSKVLSFAQGLNQSGATLDALGENKAFGALTKSANTAVPSVKNLTAHLAANVATTEQLAAAQKTINKLYDANRLRSYTAANTETGKAIAQVGKKAEGAAKRVNSFRGSLDQIGGGFVGKIKGFIGPMIAAFGASKLWNGFITEGTALTKLSDRLGVSVQELDAWGKANASAGGTADDFYKGMIKWTAQTGRSAEDFLKLGDSVRGMSKAQAEQVLNQMGLEEQARAVFVKYRGDAVQAAEAMKKFAITDDQARKAKEYSATWKVFTMYAQSLGNTIMAMVVPALTKVVAAVRDATQFFKEHEQFVTLSVKAIGLAFALLAGRKVLGSIGYLSKHIRKLVKTFGLIKGAVNGLKLAFRVNPLGVLITAFEAATLVIDDFLTFVKGGPSVLGDLLKAFGMSEGAIQSFRNGLQLISQWFEYLGALLATREWKKVGNFLLNSLEEAVNAFLTWLGNLGKDFYEAMDKAFSPIVNFDYWGFLKTSFQEAWDWIVTKFSNIGSALATAVKGAGASIANSIKAGLPDWAKKLFGLSDIRVDVQKTLGSNETAQTLNAIRADNARLASPVNGPITQWNRSTQAATYNNKADVTVNFNGNYSDPTQATNAVVKGLNKGGFGNIPSSQLLVANAMTGTQRN